MLLQAITLLILALLPYAAFAQPAPQQTAAAAPSEQTRRDARRHFERGVELYVEGNFDAALAEFSRANELLPNYKLLYNLAQVQAERHEYVAASQLFAEYLQKGGPEIPDARRSAVQKELEKLGDRIAQLVVTVDVDDASVYIDDVLVGSSPLAEPVLVNVGPCRVRVEKPEHQTLTRTIVLTGAEHVELQLQLARLSPPLTAAKHSPPATRVTSNMTPFWIGLSATLVLGGATTVLGFVTLDADRKLDRELAVYPGRSSEQASARNQLQTFAALTDGFAAATLLAAGTGLYFLLAPPERTERRPQLTATPTSLTLHGTF